MSYHRLNLVFAACLLGYSLASLAQPQKSEYQIKEDHPTTGSNIKRDVVTGSAVPLNKRYGDFTPEEKVALHQYYETIAPGDEPPFPSKGLRPIHSAIQKGQAKLLVSGDLTIFATVSAEGNVTKIEAMESPSTEMTKFVASVLLETKFKPAVCAGKPCEMQYPFAYSFRVQ